MDLGLDNKRALVTGASRGLGYATALVLAKEGCQVCINSRDVHNIQRAAEQIAKVSGSQITGLAGDLSEKGVIENIVAGAAQSMGGLDLLVTNAGGPPPGPFIDHDEAAWQKAIDLSLMSHVRLIRAALPYLRKSNTASVLTVTSITVKQPIENLVLSNSVRGATIGLTKTLALELGKDGIRFNSILPGWTETERVIELMTARAVANKTTVQEEAKRQSAASPLGRMGRPEEFANAAAFLLSPAASYITGVMLNVDGGMYKGTM